MTDASFQPYGELLQLRAEPPDFIGTMSRGWKAQFDVDGPPQVMLLSTKFSGMSFSRMERHFAVTQAFIPLGKVPCLVAVAAPTNSNDITSVPAPSAVRGFVVDGSCGYILKRGTWHSLDRYPLYDAEARIVILTSQATQDEIEAQARSDWRLTEEVDYQALHGTVLRFTW
jgi:ureidoglycolate hydrolase